MENKTESFIETESSNQQDKKEDIRKLTLIKELLENIPSSCLELEDQENIVFVNNLESAINQLAKSVERHIYILGHSL